LGGAGGQRVHADVSHLSQNFINDMVVDAQGRAYVGSRNGGTPASKSDSLILARPDGTSRILLDDMVSPNGSVITPDGRFLIIAETALGRLNRFALNPDGTLGERTILCALPGRHIDGICLDAAGGVWCGGGNGGLFHVGPDGALGPVFDFPPDRMVLATALGGPDGRTLFLATVSMKLIDNLAYIGADRTRDAEVNSDGRIEAITVDVPGVDSAPIPGTSSRPRGRSRQSPAPRP
jgi:sugar lactone lactonase YvrE